jgi:3-deoxy-D-manno-octulosonic-acid transferase
MNQTTRPTSPSPLVFKLYGWLTIALKPILRMKLWRRAVHEPMYGYAVNERYGVYSKPASQGWIWIHAVSLGETRVAAILLEQLRQAMPDLKLLLTHGTATGREEGAKLLREGDLQVWQPWDDARSTKLFFAHFRPRIGILIETEIWPMLCSAAYAQGIPLALVNARLSDRSLKKMQRLPSLIRPALQQLSLILVQTEADAQRLKSMGGKNVSVTGNIKFDSQPDKALVQHGSSLRKASQNAVVMLASSRDGEEELLLDAIREWDSVGAESRQDKRPVQWMIVPRHPQRFQQVIALCKAKGLSVSPRSTWTEHPKQADVWLGDSIGEMPMYYGLSDVALLGGSFKEFGGQNLIEALACGCPIIMGPHTYNFEQACAQAEQYGAALRVNAMSAAVAKAYEIVQLSPERQQMQFAASDWLNTSIGATHKTVLALQEILEQRSAPRVAS